MDHILDFSTAEGDVIDILGSAFGGLPTGALSATLFSTNVDGTFSNNTQRFSFDNASGTLYYDADGSDAGATAVALAKLENGAILHNTDMHVV
jgi:Ca2+-binding RTX toxin-like protein